MNFPLALCFVVALFVAASPKDEPWSDEKFTPAEIAASQELSAIQKKLLANVAPSVKPGGKLIFSVCTLTRAETTEVVADFIARFAAEFEPIEFPKLSASQSLLTSAPTKMIWPQDLNGNGMFIAGWRRKKA